MTSAPDRPKRKRLKPPTDPSSLNPACREIYLGFPDKAFREFVAPLLRFVHSRSIDPAAVNDQVIADFRQALGGYGVVDPDSFISCLVRDWNKLRGYPSFAALKPLTPPLGKRQRERDERRQLIPPHVWQELDQIHRGRLDTPNSTEHAAYNLRKRLERLIEAAALGGATITRLTDLANPTVLRRAITRLYPDTRAPSKPRDIMLSELGRVYRDAAMPQLATIVDKVRLGFPLAGLGIAPGSAASIATFGRDDIIAIARHAIAVVGQLRPGSSARRAIAHARAAIAVLLVLYNTCPRQTLEAARFTGDGTGGLRPRLHGPHGNAEYLDLEANLPISAHAALDRYYSSLASWLGQAPQGLFDAPKGEPPRSASALSTGVKRLLEDAGYAGFTLQLLRDGVNAFFRRMQEDQGLAAANGYAFESNFHYRYAALDGSDVAGKVEASFAGGTGVAQRRDR